jgi:hypothetical protein
MKVEGQYRDWDRVKRYNFNKGYERSGEVRSCQVVEYKRKKKGIRVEKGDVEWSEDEA